MSEHTPTPWEIRDDAIIGADGSHVIPYLIDLGVENPEEDARFIVQACNSHDELLEAAKGALYRYPELNRLRDAVEKAEGTA